MLDGVFGWKVDPDIEIQEAISTRISSPDILRRPWWLRCTVAQVAYDALLGREVDVGVPVSDGGRLNGLCCM